MVWERSRLRSSRRLSLDSVSAEAARRTSLDSVPATQRDALRVRERDRSAHWEV